MGILTVYAVIAVITTMYVIIFSDQMRFKFDHSQIESVDQILLGAKIAQNSLSPVAEESIDGADEQAASSEKGQKTLERFVMPVTSHKKIAVTKYRPEAGCI